MSGLKIGVENDIFWSEIGSGFGEPGGTSPPGVPLGSHGWEKNQHVLFKWGGGEWGSLSPPS